METLRMTPRHIPLGALMEPADHPDVTGRDSFGRGRLSAAANQAARDQTRLQASQDAVASEVIAFQVLQQRAHLVSGDAIDPARIIASLSVREREVIGLVGAGRSDGEIASALFISKKTASVHVANIKSKLGAASRVEIAMLAAKLRLVPDGAATQGTPDAAGWSPATVVCPFKGLASFDIGDGGYFFGRERVVAELVARLVAATFLAVVGPSGSGKSSVVRAGLVPALRAGVLPGSDEWPLAVLRPGEHPLESLSRAIRTVTGDADPVHEDHPAAEWLDRLSPDTRLVVVVDQFEEAYTVCPDVQERERFLDRLTALAGDPDRRVLVAVAVRSEFYGRLAEHRGVAGLASSSTVLLGPMTADELTRAIELPARAAGLRLDPTLVPALVTDVLQEPGALPMLSSTLLELWQRREGRSLRMETYRALGGISGAVGRIAEAVFGRLSADDQATARSIFLRLVTVGDDGIASRRRVPIPDIENGPTPDSARVMATLADGRLLTIDDGAVEPAHEALLREWPRMRGWLEEDRATRRIREHLAHAAREWNERGREPAELYRGQRLVVALEWASTGRSELNERERSFLDASRKASEAEAARQRTINVRLRGLLGSVAVLLVLALVAGTLAVGQADTARRLATDAQIAADVAQAAADDSRASATYARVRELGSASRVANLSDPSLGRLLAVSAATMLSPDLETEAVLHQAWLHDAVVQRLPAPAGRPRGVVAVNAAGTRLAEVWGDPSQPEQVLEVVDLVTGASLWSHSFSAPGVVIEQAFFSLDGSKVVTSLFWADEQHRQPPDDLGVLEFDAQTGAPLARLDAGPCGAPLTGVSAAGYLAIRLPDDAAPTCFGEADAAQAASIIPRTDVFDPTSGEWRTVVESDPSDGMVSRDGSVLAYTTPDNDAVMIDLTTGEERSRVPPGEAFPQDVGRFRAISPDGSHAIYGDRPPVLVETATGKAVASLSAGAGEIWAEAFDLESGVAFTLGRDAGLRAWDAQRGVPLFAVPGITGSTVLAIEDGRAVVVDEAGSITVTHTGPRGEAGDIRTCTGMYPGGGLQVVGTRAILIGDCRAKGKPLYAFELAPAPTITWQLGDQSGQHAALSSDGSWIARQTHESLGVEIVDAATGTVVRKLAGTCVWHSARRPEDRHLQPGCQAFPTQPFPLWVQDMQFSPDGSILAAVDLDGYVVAWDTGTGRVVGTIMPSGRPVGLVFTPDGNEIVLGTRAGAMDAYSTDTWQATRHADNPAVGVTRLTPLGFVQGGRKLIAVGGLTDEFGGSVHVLDAASLTVIESRTAHTANLKVAALSPSGTQVATAASDGVVKVWDVATLKPAHELSVPGQAQGLAFTDETHLAVVPESGDLLIMLLDRDALLEKVRSTLTRGPTPAECDTYGFVGACPTLEELRSGRAVVP